MGGTFALTVDQNDVFCAVKGVYVPPSNLFILFLNSSQIAGESYIKKLW